MEKFCPKCGKKVSATAKFCPHCGYNFALRNNNQSISTPKVSREQAKPVKKKRKGKTGILVISLLVVKILVRHKLAKVQKVVVIVLLTVKHLSIQPKSRNLLHQMILLRRSSYQTTLDLRKVLQRLLILPLKMTLTVGNQ